MNSGGTSIRVRLTARPNRIRCTTAAPELRTLNAETASAIGMRDGETANRLRTSEPTHTDSVIPCQGRGVRLGNPAGAPLAMASAPTGEGTRTRTLNLHPIHRWFGFRDVAEPVFDELRSCSSNRRRTQWAPQPHLRPEAGPVSQH
jgi:hypothetical protein